MDWMKMPPFAALRAFSAFAETGNVVQAGSMLNVSHAAISQQLRALEKHLGTSLLNRSGKSMVLTPEGEHLAQALHLGFRAIGAAVTDLVQSGLDRPVHVSLTPSFAASWLMPRLPAFQAEHPDIDLALEPTPKLVTLGPGGVDVALRYGAGGWPGVTSELLLPSPITIVAAPSLLGDKTNWTAAELSQLPWLEEFGTTEATTWLAGQGVEHGPRAGRIALPGNLLLDGLRTGQGVTVTARHFVESDIADGRLVELFCQPGNSGYHIVTTENSMRPAVRTFVSWLRRQSGRM
ncbi:MULTISPECIES: LysR family transcriptional regulator [unclassified Ruegeria]|uniref:LysR family transcriptional regulator n=1 Tax=unclassified Ruegeria TaxID=2625375 RepID=UPI001ADA6CAA|nr:MULTISPECIES: LysR family transcriptional regulator [unclassified Ruegeria]MBO9413021.1 LysR family transcriptional regulator [Ruegeria sp. R8_1]MBO9416995.1 LysR family transcriptional regulator [Ruegeria sp. R8_2]